MSMKKTLLFNILTCVYRLIFFFFPFDFSFVKEDYIYNIRLWQEQWFNFSSKLTRTCKNWFKHTKPKLISRTGKEHYVLFSRAHFCSAWTMAITSSLFFQPNLQHRSVLMSTSSAKQQMHGLTEIFIWYCIHYRTAHNLIFERFPVNYQSFHSCSSSLSMRLGKASVSCVSQGKASFYCPKLLASQNHTLNSLSFSGGNKPLKDIK